uniref:Uncharacterized protein n=1 Tax=Arundo donax TaxID=35708 RepID=A0A0A9AVZ6_ARUDO
MYQLVIVGLFVEQTSSVFLFFV